MATELDRDAMLLLAENLFVLASEFAHDANNLVLQLVAGHEMLGSKLDVPLVTAEELQRITRYSQNVTTIARDLEELLKRVRPTGD